MEETKMDAVSVYNQVKTCIKEMHEAGLHIKRDRLEEIVTDHHGSHYGKETKQMVYLMQHNREFRRALFRLDALNEFGALRRSERILDRERHSIKQGRLLTMGCMAILFIGIVVMTAIHCSWLGIEPQYNFLMIISEIVTLGIGMFAIDILVNTNTMGESHAEDGIDPIINEELYPKETKNYLFNPPNSLYVKYVDLGYVLLPSEAFAFAFYLVDLLNHPKTILLLGDRSFKDVFSKEYRKIYSEIGNCYRLFENPSQEEIDDLKLKNRAKNGGPQIYNLDKPSKKRKRKSNKTVKKLSQNGKLMQFDIPITKGEDDDHH